MSTSLRWAMTGALALHAGALVALLAGASVHPSPAGASGSDGRTASHQAMQVRWVSTAAARATAQPATQSMLPDNASQAAMEAPDQARLNAQAAAKAPANEVAMPAADAAEAYLPRSQLSKAPESMGAINIPFPAGVEGGRRYSAVLALYVDETGTVRKVQVQSATGGDHDRQLPAPLVQAARFAFMQASFAPGELNGRAVKALIHVEVQFDDLDPINASRSIGGLDGRRTL